MEQIAIKSKNIFLTQFKKIKVNYIMEVMFFYYVFAIFTLLL